MWDRQATVSFDDFAEELSQSTVGPKDGPCYVPATFRGINRKKNDADEIGIAALDADCGHTLNEIIEALEKASLEAIVHSTYSHMTTESEILCSDFDKWEAETGQGVAAYMREMHSYLPRVIADAKIVNKVAVPGKAGTYYIVKHHPCPKFRIILRLADPWRAADFTSQAAANAEWQRFIDTLAGLLGLQHDQSCTDTSRLFFLPRTREGGPEYEFRRVAGNACSMQQILAVATEDKHNCRISRIGAAKNAPGKVIPLYTQAEAERIRSALSVIPANERIIWLKIGAALHSTGWGDFARLLWDEWSWTSGKFDEADQEKTWRSFDRGYDGEKVTLGTLFHLAKEHGWNDQTPTDRRGPSQTDILLELAQSAELFHSSDGTGFADLHINGHRETWRLRAKNFRLWLLRCFFEKTGGAPGSEALQSALNVIEARAHFDAPERLVYIRVGGIDGKLYLDLCDETWRAVEIDATGWRVIGNPPVRFRRAAGMQPLPMPMPRGSIEALRSFLNVQSDSNFVLVVAWALAVLRNRGPYPVIALSGEQGSAKSTFSAILRALLDPNTAPLRALPREDRDLFIAANNGHVLAFDNVSGLPPWISDTLCRLATGGGFAVRQNYSDQDEMLFDAARPVILNGIEDIVTRPDLADRAVFLTLEPIPEERRRPEADLWAAFEAERPGILGALLDAVAHGLERLPETRLEKLPRMADCGRRPARPPTGGPGHSCRPITIISLRSLKMWSKETRLQMPCAP